MDHIDQTLHTLASELPSFTSPDQVRERRRELQTWVREQFQGLRSLEGRDESRPYRRRVGQQLNRAKAEIERLTSGRLRELETASVAPRLIEGVDLDLPAPPLRLGLR